jgi:hypothetical protein
MFKIALGTMSTHKRQLCGSCGADKTFVFLTIVSKMSDQFLEQRIYIKFCLELGNNANNTCTMLFEAYGEKAIKTSSVFQWR